MKRKRDSSAAAATSEGAKKIARTEDDEEIVEELNIDPSTAYNSLLSSLKSKGGLFAEAYAKRQKDEHGAGTDDEEEPPEVKKRGAKRGTESGNGNVHDEERNHLNVGDDDDKNTINVDQSEYHSDEEEGPSVDDFKTHLEHVLTDEEIRSLDAGSWKLNAEEPALGIPKAKWITNRADLPKAESKLSAYNVKERLRKNWETVVKKKCGDFRSEQQSQFFALCNSYSDIFHSRKASLIGTKGSSEITDAYLLHILNHLLKTRDLVIKNNEKLAKHKDEKTNLFDVPRDQGFTRPKVLFLLPYRSIALMVVKRLIELAPPTQKTTVAQKERFFTEYGVEKPDKEDLNEKKTAKPRDHQSLFGGNNSDDFKIGIKFTRKSINLYSDFHSSDIIIASPIELKTLINECERDKEKDADYLSSIEILVVDFADVILMQNWSHLVNVWEHLNKIPSKQHDFDIMRVREWYLDGRARYFRQNIILSSYADPAINALLLRNCFNYRGKIRLQCNYEGVLSNVVLQVRQVFERIDCSSITDIDNARFEFFTKKVYPRLKDSLEGGFLLFVRSSFDYLRIKHFLHSEEYSSFGLLGEEVDHSDISRVRSDFFHKKKRIMLYTERAHFYHRFQIRGIRELIFYGLPDHATFYSELTNMLEGVENPSCTAIYSKYDNLQLERIVGTQRAKKLLSSKTKTLMFC